MAFIPGPIIEWCFYTMSLWDSINVSQVAGEDTVAGVCVHGCTFFGRATRHGNTSGFSSHTGFRLLGRALRRAKCLSVVT